MELLFNEWEKQTAYGTFDQINTCLAGIRSMTNVSTSYGNSNRAHRQLTSNQSDQNTWVEYVIFFPQDSSIFYRLIRSEPIQPGIGINWKMSYGLKWSWLAVSIEWLAYRKQMCVRFARSMKTCDERKTVGPTELGTELEWSSRIYWLDGQENVVNRDWHILLLRVCRIQNLTKNISILRVFACVRPDCLTQSVNNVDRVLARVLLLLSCGFCTYSGMDEWQRHRRLDAGSIHSEPNRNHRYKGQLAKSPHIRKPSSFCCYTFHSFRSHSPLHWLEKWDSSQTERAHATKQHMLIQANWLIHIKT